MWRWNKRFISNRCSAEKFPWSLCQPPKCIVDTTDIRNTLDVFYIYFFRQWVAEIKLKKPSIFTCDFVSKFVARYWYKIVTSPFVLGTVSDFAKRSSEMEDLMHNWKVFFNVINKDCLYFTSKIFIVVVIIRDETKRIVLNIFTTVNKICNEWVYVLYSLLQ